jgi:hypothetical protein
MVRPDRQLPVAAIDEDRESDRLRPPEVDESVHCGPDRASRVEDVVDQDHRPPVEVEREVRSLHHGLLGNDRQVVAIEGDVEGADGQVDRLVLADRIRDPAGQRDAPALDADQGEAVRSGLLLDDLVGDADGRAADLLGGHDLAPAHTRGPDSAITVAPAHLLPGLTGPVVKGNALSLAQGRSAEPPAGV